MTNIHWSKYPRVTFRHGGKIRGATTLFSLFTVAVLGLAGCAQSAGAAEDAALPNPGKAPLRVVTTTGILADLTQNVLGDQGSVTALVPPGADPHSYEPSLRQVREVAYADVAFSNHLLLEEQALMRLLDANLPARARHVKVAENSVRYGANLIPLVEDPSLNTIWLGMRVRGDGKNLGATATSTLNLAATDLQFTPSATAVKGFEAGEEGILSAYLTGTFGQPQPYFSSSNGLTPQGCREDCVNLPTNAHTHMSWAFTQPGVYRLKVSAALNLGEEGHNHPTNLAEATITFAVGVDPHSVPQMSGATILSTGHLDVTVDLDESSLYLWGDRVDGKPGNQAYDPSQTVIWVPQSALNTVPADPKYRFMGRPAAPAYVLAQAVLGKHVHGEIDPHLWLSVPNAEAYVQVIRDALSAAKPQAAAVFTANAQAYLDRLEALHKHVGEVIESIPPKNRQLITTHDAYGYLGAAYGLNVAGFVTPNPGLEPSARDIIALTNTVDSLRVPAVFLEPNVATHSRELRRIAGAAGIRICRIFGDSFTPEVNTYVDLMAQNAHNLKVCLDPESAPPPPFQYPYNNPPVTVR